MKRIGAVLLGLWSALAYGLLCLSYAAFTPKARLAAFDPTLELAAQDLGAPPLQAFRRVTSPLLVLASQPRQGRP
jgi:ABC-type spermidine/putrescine transport system permease subunit II